MKALTWQGINKLEVETVDDPTILDDQDVVLEVRATATCGSDLHLLGGYIPAMREGDILGHEFLGEVVEAGPGVNRLKVGDRVVVCSIISCGRCWHCLKGEFSLCDNTNPHASLPEAVWGHSPAGIFGYSQMTGGFAGSHAEYVRVPFADQGCFVVPEGLDDDSAVYASDAVPTGWMGADLADIAAGDVVAVWGAGGVGQMAAKAALLLGAGAVVVIDRFENRLRQVEDVIGAVPLNYEEFDDVHDVLLDMTGGRGPDRCIEAVGMEAHGDDSLQYAYDKVKQAVRLESERGVSLRQAIRACRKGGTVSVLGVFGGFIDKFPFGAAMNKGLTLRGAQQHGQRYIPMLLDRMAAGEIPTAHLTTHPMSLDDAPRGYEMFKEKEDGCVRAVFHPREGASRE